MRCWPSSTRSTTRATAAGSSSAPKPSGWGRVLAALLPDEPEADGLLALMIHHARRRARFSGEDLVSLDDQDLSLWDMGEIAAGRAVLDRALTQAGDPAADRAACGDR
jgi:predicted RNA polymerase sigma factor